MTVLDSCPHCGGDSGFYYKFADVQVQFVEWSGELVECNNDTPIYMRKRRCVDCNKIVENETKDIDLHDGRFY